MSNTDLSVLTKEAFNTLYPVELVNHDSNWKLLYKEQEELILSTIDQGWLKRVEHFGSTAIPGIKAKPYIDMIIEIEKELLFDEKLIQQFKSIGFQYFKVPERDDIDAYMSFGKGYYNDGTKAQIFHIHMCPADNFMWTQVAFRDYLIANPDHATAYEKLKLALASKFPNDRGAYVLGKAEFVMETLSQIKNQ